MSDEGELTGGELCNIAVIGNQRGLHARAAAKFVRIADTFQADVTIMKDNMRVSARSIMGLMMLAAVKGTQVSICASGADAPQAVQALTEFVQRNFDEE
jgi:phosphocarrier protein HPr